MDPTERAECIAHVSKSQATLSPGPAYYNVTHQFDTSHIAPIKMKGRYSLPTQNVDAPYYKIPSTLGKVPAIRLHGRAQAKTAASTPGPTYMPPSFGSGARKIGFAPLPKLANRRLPKDGKNGAATSLSRRTGSETLGPGPCYNIRDHTFDANGKVGIVFKGCHDFKYANTVSPGPANYNPKFTAVLPAAPKIGFHDRPKDKAPATSPGYIELKSTLTGPSFTMKARAIDDINII